MNKKIHRVIIVIAAFCVGWFIYTLLNSISGYVREKELQTEQTNSDPEPLVINTVERQDDIMLTVIRGEDTVFQYAGDIELWKGSDGKAYGLIYLDEEVCQ